MDEEYNDSVDTSTGIDVSDVDVSDDIPDDIHEDDYSDADVADDFSEDVPEETFEDDVEYDDIDEPVEDDSIEPENEEFDEPMDDIEEDTLEESEEVSDDYGEPDDISEDTDGFDEELENEIDEAEDIPEDVDYTEMADQDEAFEEDIPEDVIDTDDTEEAFDVEDTDTSEQSEDVSDAEAADETSDVDNTDTPEQPEDVTDTETTDETSDVENTDTSDQSDVGNDTEEAKNVVDIEDADTAEQTDGASNDIVSASDGSGGPICPKCGQYPCICDEDVSDFDDKNESNNKDTSDIHSVMDYMNAHNYGRDDFATYSQDPQWRQLMRQEYPDYELPEMTQETANTQLMQYMSKHNYGIGDYAEYSQDPIWRELHSTAYPDFELPPLQNMSDDVNSGDFTEPTEDIQDKLLDDTATDDVAEDIVFDVDNGDSAELTEDTQDELLDDTRDVSAAEKIDEIGDVEDTDTTERPGNMTDTEEVEENFDVEDTNTAEKPKDVTDIETMDEILDVEDTDISNQSEDMTNVGTTDEATDVEDTNSADQLEDVSDAEAMDEAFDIEDIDTMGKPEDAYVAEQNEVSDIQQTMQGEINNVSISSTEGSAIDAGDETGEENITEYQKYKKPFFSKNNIERDYGAYSISDAENVSDEERRVLQDYTSDNPKCSYSNINKSLYDSEFKAASEQEESMLENEINILTDCLDKKELQRHTELYRGIKSASDIFGEDVDTMSPEEIIEKYTGIEYINPAFTSTSCSKDVAQKFADSAWGKYSGLLTIKAPKGTKGMCVGDISSFGSSEGEVLLQRGTRYRLDKIAYKNGQFNITMTAIGNVR